MMKYIEHVASCSGSRPHYELDDQNQLVETQVPCLWTSRVKLFPDLDVPDPRNWELVMAKDFVDYHEQMGWSGHEMVEPTVEEKEFVESEE
jgi:hypothetical protein